jgi:hypothetical protein
MAHKNPGADSFDDGFDDEFDDDVFANITENELQTLEHQATLATQRLPQQRQHQHLPKPAQVYNFNQNFREDIINLDDHPQGNFRDAARNAHDAGFPTQARPPAAAPYLSRQPSLQGRFPPSSNSIPVRSKDSPSQNNVPELLAVIKRLEQEKIALKKRVDSATATAQVKTGEASIIRQKFQKSTQDYELRLQQLRGLHAEALAEREAHLAAVQKERHDIETDNRFLKHDIAIEAGKAKATQRAKSAVDARSKTAFDASLNTTPKKPSRSFGDGFDGETAIPWSPSKLRDFAKPSTPSRRPEKKRKRDDHSSMPTNELPIVGTRGENTPVHPFSPFSQRSALDHVAEDAVSDVHIPDEKAELLQHILDHQAPDSEDRLLEALATFCFPSAPRRKFSRILMDSITAVPPKASAQHLAAAVCDALHHLWQGCLNEKFYTPLDVVVDAVQFIVNSQPFSFSRRLISTMVPLCTSTAELVAIPIANAAIQAQRGSPLNQPLLPPEIKVQPSLELLNALATACQRSKEHIRQFWHAQILSCHFILLMLYQAQPINQISSMVTLLRLSILPSTFGIIVGDVIDPDIGAQEDTETHIIDRLTNLLFEIPPSADLEKELDVDELLIFRNSIITTLKKMCMLPYSASALATHRFAIARLIRFLHESIDSLYLPHTTQEGTHHLVTWGINMTMRLLYFLLTKFSNKIDIREKLRAEEGGAQMHLMALTRLAFCEPVLLESGIDPEASDAAHTLLDLFLSPVEGEQVLAMFASMEGNPATLAHRLEDSEDGNQPMDIDGDTVEFSTAEASQMRNMLGR